MSDTPTFIRGGHIVVRRDRARRSTAAMAKAGVAQARP